MSNVFMSIWMFSSALLVQAQPTTQPTTTPPEFPEIVAKVNGTEITRTALLNRAEALKGQIAPQQVGADFYQRVLGDMVDGELLYQSVEKKGLVPTAQEVDAEVESQKGRFGGEMELAKALEAQGLTLEDLKLELKKELAIQKLIESEYLPAIVVTADEKKKFYDENSAQMQRPDQFRAAHILILVEQDSTPEVKEEARKKAGGIRSMLDSGRTSPSSLGKTRTIPARRTPEASFPGCPRVRPFLRSRRRRSPLAPGQISPVVETDFGFHIIKLHEKRSAGLMPYEEVEGRIDEFLKRRSLQQRIETEIQTLKTQGKVEVFI